MTREKLINGLPINVDVQNAIDGFEYLGYDVVGFTLEDVSEPIQNALYATNAFTTDQCSNITNGILLYLKDAGFEIVKRQ